MTSPKLEQIAQFCCLDQAESGSRSPSFIAWAFLLKMLIFVYLVGSTGGLILIALNFVFEFQVKLLEYFTAN
jgi:hypothetical protein